MSARAGLIAENAVLSGPRGQELRLTAALRDETAT